MNERTYPNLVILVWSSYLIAFIRPVIAFKLINFYKVKEIFNTYGLVGNGKL